MTFEPNTQTIMSLWTKQTLINRKLDATLGAIHGMGFTEYMVLQHLLAAPRHMLRRIDLAQQLGRSASGITKMLNPMEKIGLVSKEVNPRDARVSLVKITTSGEKLFSQATQTVNQTAEQLFGRMDAEQTSELLQLLHAIDV